MSAPHGPGTTALQFRSCFSKTGRTVAFFGVIGTVACAAFWTAFTSSSGDSGRGDCHSCGSPLATDTLALPVGRVNAAPMALAGGADCTDCPKVIAGDQSDRAFGLRATYRDLASTVAHVNVTEGDVLYTIATVPFFLDKPEAPPAGDDGTALANSHNETSAEAGNGRLLPATPVTVVLVDPEWMQVEIGVRLQQESGSVPVVLPGGDDLSAAPGNLSQNHSGLTGQDGTLTAWIARRDLMADQAVVWAYEDQTQSDGCLTCDTASETGIFPASPWIGMLDPTNRLVALGDERLSLSGQNVQEHAQGTGAIND